MSEWELRRIICSAVGAVVLWTAWKGMLMLERHPPWVRAIYISIALLATIAAVANLISL